MSEIKLMKKGRKFTNIPAFERIGELKKGEFLIMTNDEWEFVERPSKHNIKRRLGIECKTQTLADESGWRIERL